MRNLTQPLSLAATLLLLLGRAAAGPPPAEDKGQADFQPAVIAGPVLTMDQRTDVGAAMLVLDGFPKGDECLSLLTLLSAGENRRIWSFWDPNIVRHVAEDVLAEVKDNTTLTQEIGSKEQDAYFYMLFYANRTAPEALDEEAKKNAGADWAHVFRVPRDYRGEVVHFEGKLIRLREFPPQPMAAQAGVKHYYEGCMYADLQENDPVFFVVTELPKGLEPADNLDVKVGFSGYFFKILRYTAGDTKKEKKDRLAPLCIGRTLTLTAAPAVDESAADPSWVAWLGPAFFGVLGLTVAVLFAIGFWFRRGDSRVRGRLYAARHAEFIPPPAEEAAAGPAKPAAPDAPRNRLSEGERGASAP